MIKIRGTLAIRRIEGRHGPFNIARLSCSIGDFAVKDQVLDEYDEGKYNGAFVIARILPSHYQANGRLVMEVRAQLHEIILDGVDALAPDEAASLAVVEADPMDEVVSVQVPPQDPARPPSPPPRAVSQSTARPSSPGSASTSNRASTSPPALAASATPSVTADNAADAALFGVLWPLGPTVKLDPTVDRGAFRAQRDRLKVLGYVFQPLTQSWSLQS